MDALRATGSHEVRGSIPLGSTKNFKRALRCLQPVPIDSFLMNH